MALTLTGYGGVGEIGGNAFLLDDGKSRIFLDLGKRFGSDPPAGERVPGWNDYYDSFLPPRGHSMVPDLMRLGIIPPVPELYRQDRGGAAGPRPADAVLVSHAHMDHCGLLGLLRPDIPILMSQASTATLESLQATGQGVLAEYLDARPKGILPRKDGGPGKGTSWKENGEPVTVRRPVHEGDGELGDWHLRHFDIDHSIHGARGTVLEGPASIVYTGDFRLHGRHADGTKRFLEKAGGADIAITEGTRVSHDHDHAHGNTDDESHVEKEIGELVTRAGDRFVGVSYPPRDLDRFESVWRVARQTGRRLVIPTKSAHLLDAVRGAGQTELPDPKSDPHVAIHVPVKGRGVLAMPPDRLRMPDRDLSVLELAVDDDTWNEFWLADHAQWEEPYILSENTVTSAQIADAPSQYIFSISYWTISELLDIFPPDGNKNPGGVYIHSMTQPFNDEMEIGDRKLMRWLDAFDLERHDTHVSGHLSEEDLHWALDEIGARRLVPVHSEAPDVTAHKYEARTGHKALVPEWGKRLELG